MNVIISPVEQIEQKMSFFNSLQQYVTSGVAGLGLSPRRFSLSRQESGEQPAQQPPPVPPIPTERRESGNSQHHGFPKVVPSPGTITSPQSQGSVRRQSRTLNCLASPRKGSFRSHRIPPIQQPSPIDRPPLAFCKRRLSWPEVEMHSTSGIQETDGSYFETFTALAWKRDNRRLSAVRNAETRAESLPEKEQDSQAIEELSESFEVKEHLYVDVLRTIGNSIGAPTPGGQVIAPLYFYAPQFQHYKEEMFLQAQRAFGVSPERHYRLLHAAAEEKPRIVVLTVMVYEADNLEAKDVNGFSDPYCMLGIQPGGTPISPLPPTMTPRTLSDVGFDNNLDSPHQSDKLRKHHSFRLSFKRKEGKREHRDSFGGPVPARFIRATSIKSHTLSPKWHEKFKFDIDDINMDIFHLDIWDHDDESCVLDAVSHLNEVRTVRGLGRYFKQVCQSARQGTPDDFLGSINIPISDIPSTGMDGWFKLEGRSNRNAVQGKLRLKLWLSTREDRGISEEDEDAHDHDIKKLERLQKVLMTHEIATHEPSWTWSGELPGTALTILHQMAVQNDLSDLHCSLAKFVAAVQLNRSTPMDPKFLHRLLVELDRVWNSPNQPKLSREIEQWLAEAMTSLMEKSLSQIRQHRDIFPALHPPSLIRLEFLLRCLGLLGSMKAFRQVCPFSKGVRGEIVCALRKGSIQWAQFFLRETQRLYSSLIFFATTLIASIQLGLSYYHPLFDSTNGIQYFSIVYKQFDAILAEEVSSRMESGQVLGNSLSQCTVLEGDKEPADTRPFELYLVLQEFAMLKIHLSVMPQPPEKMLALQNYYEWFETALIRWIMVTKAKALQRVRAAISLDRISEGERIVRHSTSSVDVADILYQMREFWKLLSWPDQQSAINFESQLVDAVCSVSIHYADLIHQQLADTGYYEQQGPFRTSDDMCVTVNNLEHVRRALAEYQSDKSDMEKQDPTDILLESTLAQLENRAERVISKLAPSMQIPLQKAVFHLAWSPESLPTTQAIVPLLEYLDIHLSALNSALLTKNFNRTLTLIWSTVLNELSRQMDAGGEGEKTKNFHDRLYEALQLLVDFFNAEGLGLPFESLHNDEYWRIEQRLQYHKKDTENLIDLFYLQRLQEQMMVTSTGPYGVLAVRAYFNHDSLCVEVLHARDIIPLDPNGFSDPFVIVELLPRRIFLHCSEQQTNVHKKTLNPNFDECFEFSVTLEQCLSEGSMIAFTVMDHDVLTANDFAGEAFLALGNIPGVADYSTSVENFHGLKQVDLPLMQQNDKNHPILQILESRTGDKQATEFVRKQKARLAS